MSGQRTAGLTLPFWMTPLIEIRFARERRSALGILRELCEVDSSHWGDSRRRRANADTGNVRSIPETGH